MGKIGFVFAGQGAQYPGMGRELQEISGKAKSVFDMADQIRPGTSVQCFTASKEELSITENTQPCLFAVELATAVALEEQGIKPDAVAGFSLGEISALTYAGVFTPKDGFQFVLQRGKAMNEAAGKNPGKMAAILKLTAGQVEDLCSRYESVWPVNYNCPGQTVISGKEESVQAVMEQAKSLGGKGILLAVSGAFHSPFMKPAGKELERILAEKELAMPSFPIYSNVTGEIAESGKLRQLIALQAQSPVLWTKTIESMMQDGVDTFIEIGPGKVLSGLIKKISAEVTVMNVEDQASLQNAVQLIKKAE